MMMFDKDGNIVECTDEKIIAEINEMCAREYAEEARIERMKERERWREYYADNIE